MNLITSKEKVKTNLQSRFTRFGLVLVLIGCGALVSKVECQTATYSDTYIVDNSGVTYDPENDAYVYPEEPAQPSVIAGVGVTDADYNSYSESIETTLTSPDGRSVSGVSYDTPYSRVELSLTPIDDDNEYQYDVQTVHTYWVDEPEPGPGSECPPNQPCMIQTAYTTPPMLNFFQVFTYFWIRVKPTRSSYQFTGYSIVPPPFFTARLCFMGKICGSCGSNTGILQKLPWQGCPQYLGATFLRYSTPFGSWCSPPVSWQQGVLYFCS